MMSSTNEEDPFLQVQQDVIAQLQTARPLFASYLRIRGLSSTANSPELVSAKSDLESALSTLSEDLGDLHEAIAAVESDPASFGISNAEMARRKRLVQEVGGEIDDMQEELAKRLLDAGAKGGRNRNNELPPPSSFAIDDSAAGGAGDDNYAQFEQEQQLQMMRDQDQMVDGVFVTVGNLRRQAEDMGQELEEQHEMLEEVDTRADRVGRRLQNGMARLGHIARQNEDKYSSFCIAALIFVLILLLILLLVL